MNRWVLIVGILVAVVIVFVVVASLPNRLVCNGYRLDDDDVLEFEVLGPRDEGSAWVTPSGSRLDVIVVEEPGADGAYWETIYYSPTDNSYWVQTSYDRAWRDGRYHENLTYGPFGGNPCWW